MRASRAVHGPRSLVAALALAMFGAALDAAAQATPPNRDQEMVLRLRQQLAQAQEQLAAAQQRATATAAERDALAAQLRVAQGQLARQRRDRAGEAAAEQAAARQASAAEAAQAALRDERDEARTARRSMAMRLAQGEHALDGLRSQLKDRDLRLAETDKAARTGREALTQCTAANGELLALGQDLVARLSNIGFGDVLAAREPVLQVRRVQLENQAAEQRRLLERLRVTPASQ